MATQTKISPLGAEILQHLRSSRSRKPAFRTAADMGVVFEEFVAAFETISCRHVIRVRGQGGFVCAA
ncbi:hypothetical protein [Beijerinckia sp. L45]|uniref:hypothetical protein n=1 Tax=Beijerinckia sp. L45 TaxID=1641855 RepID=UPI00131A67D6|nr:hypothetical protein [Beijerinckia sp. L45]